VVFGTKRDNKPDSELREDVVGSLYPDSFPNEDDMAQNSMEYRRGDPGNESVIDPHARFNGKYVSDRDLRIEGEANGEIECSGTLIISPQAKVRSMITAANVIINGDYEGDVNWRPLRDRVNRPRQGEGQGTGPGGARGSPLRGRRDHDARGARLLGSAGGGAGRTGQPCPDQGVPVGLTGGPGEHLLEQGARARTGRGAPDGSRLSRQLLIAKGHAPAWPA